MKIVNWEYVRQPEIQRAIRFGLNEGIYIVSDIDSMCLTGSLVKLDGIYYVLICISKYKFFLVEEDEFSEIHQYEDEEGNPAYYYGW